MIFLKITILFNFFHLVGIYFANTPGFNLSSFYSNELLIVSLVLSVICFFIDWFRYKKGKEYLLNYGWIVFLICFTVLALNPSVS